METCLREQFNILPETVQTDNGKEFSSQFKVLLDAYGIRHIKGRPYHP